MRMNVARRNALARLEQSDGETSGFFIALGFAVLTGIAGWGALIALGAWALALA